MKLTFTTLDGGFVSLDLADDMELENVKALCEMDLGVPAGKMVLSANGRDLTDNSKTLQSCGLKDGDMVLVKMMGAVASTSRTGASTGTPPTKIPKIDFSSIQVPQLSRGTSAGTSSAASANSSGFSPAELMQARLIGEQLKKSMEGDPTELERQMAKFPGLVDAALKSDYAAIAQFIRQEEAEALRKRQLLITNPDSHEAQEMIQDLIRRERIQENFEYALEHAPENLATVHMLYVNCSVNGVKMKAFVDSGAQISIISREFAERCHIAHLIDDRFQGMAVGVGTQRFVGKIHACQMEFGGAFLTTSFSVLDGNNMQILLGLDMMKRHQMIIDLKRNVLVIGTTGAETAFLHESEIPQNNAGQPQFVPNESDIQALIGMGFSREAARESLVKHEGNKDAAVADLLHKQADKATSAKPK
ncbi:protein DDI1 homolog 2-like [Paramacrobiotus metropolitanus]|uniref:protein DDI1 homolog 2-like n=1 Tax=Paramacrobiotus metropolitanus TaxID=2943436 RepID=UPI0024464905|nr:protein DDI1 homolog 2-like [Paramacrobiotus metropolitanus]